jgi:hypothetical protein
MTSKKEGGSMRSRLAIMAGAVLIASLVLGGPATADARSPKGLDALPALDAAEAPLDLIGDAGGARLGVSILSDTQAIAYLCNGANLGVWFKGTVDPDTGAVSLESDGGDTVTLNLNDNPTTASVTVDGETTTFTLTPATKAGRVLRVVNKGRGHRYTTGWIVADDYSVVGITADESGKTVAATNTSSSPPPPPVAGSEADPAATGALRCAILAGRINRQARLAEEEAAAGNAATADSHGKIVNGLFGVASGLGCAGF